MVRLLRGVLFQHNRVYLLHKVYHIVSGNKDRGFAVKGDKTVGAVILVEHYLEFRIFFRIAPEDDTKFFVALRQNTT